MLRITVELVPYGIEAEAKKIGEMVIANTGTGKEELGSYVAWTGPDDWTGEKAKFGRLEKFSRRQSVWELVRLILETMKLEKHEPSKKKTSIDQRLKKRLS